MGLGVEALLQDRHVFQQGKVRGPMIGGEGHIDIADKDTAELVLERGPGKLQPVFAEGLEQGFRQEDGIALPFAVGFGELGIRVDLVPGVGIGMPADQRWRELQTGLDILGQDRRRKKQGDPAGGQAPRLPGEREAWFDDKGTVFPVRTFDTEKAEGGDGGQGVDGPVLKTALLPPQRGDPRLDGEVDRRVDRQHLLRMDTPQPLPAALAG